MSLNGAMEVGRSALIASQTALQVTGSNLANAATEGYTRRAISLAPKRDEIGFGGQYVGRGVEISGIVRVVDESLLARLRDAIGEEQSARAERNFLTQLEALQNELSENDLSSLLSEFFNSWSEVANNPEDGATRAVVVQQGVSIASRISNLREDYAVLRNQIDDQIANTVDTINDLVSRVGQLNFEIAQLEVEAGEAASLRDQRDQMLNQISEYFEIDVYEQPSGAVNVLVNSLPIVLGSDAPGIEMRRESVGDQLEVRLAVRDRGFEFQPTSGSLGALLEARETGVNRAIDELETFAGSLITEVNRIHTSGQSQVPVTRYVAANPVDDLTVNLNLGDAGLPSPIENGSLMVHLTHLDSGQRIAYRVDVAGDEMSLQDLAVELSASLGGAQMSASIDAERRLVLEADPGYAISFSDDTSGALAALGINSFFTGTGAGDIDVTQALQDIPARLAVGADHVGGSNGTAVAIATMQDERIEALDGLSLREYWQNAVNQLAVRSGQAGTAVETNGLVRESLDAQFQSISGVSVDEETINLLTYQRQFQAASRYISTIDETMQELLRLI